MAHRHLPTNSRSKVSSHAGQREMVFRINHRCLHPGGRQVPTTGRGTFRQEARGKRKVRRRRLQEPFLPRKRRLVCREPGLGAHPLREMELLLRRVGSVHRGRVSLPERKWNWVPLQGALPTGNFPRVVGQRGGFVPRGYLHTSTQEEELSFGSCRCACRGG